jgi:hypothetical protein
MIWNGIGLLLLFLLVLESKNFDSIKENETLEHYFYAASQH